MKKILTTLSLLFLMLIGYVSSAQVLQQSDLKESSVYLNNMCPTMIDAITRLDNTSVPGYFIFEYDYTIITMLKSDIPENFYINQEQILIKGVKNAEAMKPLRENNVTFKYVYYDKEHNFIASFTISPDKYNQYY